MNDPGYDVTVTVPGSTDPCAYAAAAENAASARAASVMTAHTAEKTISVVTVDAQTKARRSPGPWRWSPTRLGSRPWTFDRLNVLTCEFTSQVDEICALK
jgi:hypothetical protein